MFTVVDMHDAVWHVKLSDSSSYLCTFNTPWGRKNDNRMSFGLSSARKVLLQRNEETLGNLPNVFIGADDIIIAGSDENDHDNALHTVMQRAREWNLKFSPGNLQFPRTYSIQGRTRPGPS